jgi:tRNA (guanine10-N2)-dimethyltransferase
MPRMARTLVNLSRAREGEWLLDPFSGTAGILVEACLVGIKGVGLEVQKRLIRGAQANTEGLDCSLLWADARCQPFKQSSIDAAVLDIPYGRSALICAPSKEALLKKGLAELYEVLKPARHMVIAADSPIQSLICFAGFKIQEAHMDRVHRSLTRHIFLCQK